MYANEDFLIELLTESGNLSQADIDAIKPHKKPKETIIEALLRSGKLAEEVVAQQLAVSSGMDYIDLSKIEIDSSVAETLDPEVALRYKVVPVGFNGSQLYIAVSDPLDFDTLDSVRHLISYDAEFVCATQSQIRQTLLDIYSGQLTAEQIRDLHSGKVSVSEPGGSGGGPISAEGEGDGGDAPIIRLVHQILQEAYQNRASDIHIEPLENELRIRYRIDGALHKIAAHPRRLMSAVVSRIKIMTGSMSIAEKRLPQDGRIQASMGDKDLDLRVSTVPTSHGESVVMRILDKQSLMLGLPQLGFMSDDQETFDQLIRLPDGILLVTGPTGSGKTTTLYACLNTINKPDRKIITVEDPVEYLMSGINQVQVKEDIGMTFAAALRAILRQAPNIIMIGEIRDLETASIAINASLTGHLVFSTLHTNDAPSAVARLADIGVKRFLIASAVRAILAQRLVRFNCPDCSAPATLSEKDLRTLKLTAEQLNGSNIKSGTGCRTCRNTGYKGRKGIFEIFRIDQEVSHLINQNETTPKLRRRARELGMRTLREDGVRKVLAGLTTASEVIRVTMSDSN
ncbi:MAG: Flp pilus assembly complex ATPase component TadA [Verrucomicrobiales bacterium]|nr:Flp pilus assembly complex ATPase component TadA [Verrucomicrobiales bacterium]